MKLQVGGDECGTDTHTLVPPVGRPRRRALMQNWQAALHAATLFVSIMSLTMSSIVFMVLLYTPASGPLEQGSAIADLRAVSDLQRQVMIQTERKVAYMEARQKVLAQALQEGGLLTEDIQDRLDGIERALAAKIAQENKKEKSGHVAPTGVSTALQALKARLIGRPDGHDQHSSDLIGRPDGHDQHSSDLIGRPDGHDQHSSDLIGRPDGHDQHGSDLIGRPDGDQQASAMVNSFPGIRVIGKWLVRNMNGDVIGHVNGGGSKEDENKKEENMSSESNEYDY